MPSTDPMAATVAENAIRDILRNRPRDGRNDVARAVVDEFYATFEYRDGNRRVVLTGQWEVDPAVHTRAPAFSAADQG